MRTWYVFTRKATYASRFFLIASTWRWQSMDASFKVAMTVDGVLDCSSRCDGCRWSIRLMWPSWLVAPDDLSEGYDLPSFLYDDLDFRLGRPFRLVLRVPLQYSFVYLALESPILTSTVSLMMSTYLAWCSKFTVRYSLCKMLVRWCRMCTMVLLM